MASIHIEYRSEVLQMEDKLMSSIQINLVLKRLKEGIRIFLFFTSCMAWVAMKILGKNGLILNA